MARKKNNTIITGILFLIPLLVSAYLYYYTLVERTNIGYFDSPLWIFLNTVSYLVFWSIIIVFIGFFVEKWMKKLRIKK